MINTNLIINDLFLDNPKVVIFGLEEELELVEVNRDPGFEVRQGDLIRRLAELDQVRSFFFVDVIDHFRLVRTCTAGFHGEEKTILQLF